MASFYAVICPDCRGRMFIGHTICPTCSGDGRILIPEDYQRPVSRKERAIRIVIFVAIVLLFAIAGMVNR